MTEEKHLKKELKALHKAEKQVIEGFHQNRAKGSAGHNKSNVQYKHVNNGQNKGAFKDNAKEKLELQRLKDRLARQTNQIKELRSGLAATVKSSACDGPHGFGNTGENKYLRSLLVPSDGAASIPDDVMRMHTLRSETITTNIPMNLPSGSTTATTVSGVMLFYPNHPTSLLGHVWMSGFANDGVTPVMNYLQQVSVAQELSEAYDYGRRVSCEVNVKSSTLPSGMYAINGTFNAVRVDGTASELALSNDSSELYSELLASTTNLYDKLGNVSVGDGLTVLGLPDSFVNPYVRMNDPAVETLISSNGGFTQNQLFDDSQNLSYCTRFNHGSNYSSGGGKLAQGTFNFDATVGLEIEFMTKIAVGQLAPAGTSIPIPQYTDIYITYNVDLLDVFGNVIYAYYDVASNVYEEDTFAIDGSVMTFGAKRIFMVGNMGDPAAADFVGPALNAPVAAIDVTVIGSIGGSSSVVNNYTMPAGPENFTSIKCKSFLGTRPGVLSPVVAVAFQNVAVGSVITVSGVANYELQPNPELRRNLETKYAHYSPDELSYAKMVISNRHTYNIRSVFPTPDYKVMKEHFRDLACLKVPKLESAALSWKDVIGFGRRLVKPLGDAAKFLVPESEPLVDAISALSSRAASGYSIGSRAASGNQIMMSNMAFSNGEEKPYFSHDAFEEFLCELLEYEGPVEPVFHYETDDFWAIVEQIPLTVDYAVENSAMHRRRGPVQNFLRIKSMNNSENVELHGRHVLFPTLTTITGNLGCTIEGEGLFGIFPLNMPFYKRSFAEVVYTPTLGNGKIYGWKNPDDYRFPIELDHDVCFLPIDPNSLVPRLYVPRNAKWPVVSDHSCDGAIWVYKNCEFEGQFPLAITGALNLNVGVPYLQPNAAFSIKIEDLHRHGRRLAANDKLADVSIDNLREILKLDLKSQASQSRAFFMGSVKRKTLHPKYR